MLLGLIGTTLSAIVALVVAFMAHRQNKAQVEVTAKVAETDRKQSALELTQVAQASLIEDLQEERKSLREQLAECRASCVEAVVTNRKLEDQVWHQSLEIRELKSKLGMT